MVAVDHLSVVPAGFGTTVAEALPAVVRRIIEALHPARIILFGSYVYGHPTPDSDVDLLIIADAKGPATERYLAVSDALYPRPFPIDILVRTPREVEQALQEGDFFIREIVTRGRVLYERRD